LEEKKIVWHMRIFEKKKFEGRDGWRPVFLGLQPSAFGGPQK
jgi:hypothetical protein